jgi:cytidyltransferase-like protein
MSSSPRDVLAIYPGSFDPVTLGHEDIARRTLRLADRLLLAVAETATHSKDHLFSVQTKRRPLHYQGASSRFRFRVRNADGSNESGALA